METRSLPALVLALMATGASGGAMAGEGAPAGVEEAPPGGKFSLWPEGIGGGFRKDTFRGSLSLGGGPGIAALGGREDHHLLFQSASLGWVFTDRIGPIHGNLEAGLELFAGEQVDPAFRQLFGGAALLRYDLALGSRLVPFAAIGLGVSETDIYGKDLSTLFEFALEGGVGAHWFLSETTAFTGEWRWLHLSNAAIELPNHGVNTQLFLFGVSFFF